MMGSNTNVEVEDVLFQLQLQGWFLFENVIPRDQVGAVGKSVEATAREVRRKSGDTPSPYVVINDVLNVNQSFASWLSSPRLLDPLRALFGPYIRLRTARGFVSHPGTERGSLHADAPYIQSAPVRVPAPYPDVAMKFTAVWMLSDFTAENGATLLIPGSHRAEDNGTGGLELPIPHPSEIQATGCSGSVVLFDSRLWHAPGGNRSDRARVGLVMTYFPWWLSQEPAMPKGTPERERLKEETGLTDEELGGGTDWLPSDVYGELPDDLKPLVRHWVRP